MTKIILSNLLNKKHALSSNTAAETEKKSKVVRSTTPTVHFVHISDSAKMCRKKRANTRKRTKANIRKRSIKARAVTIRNQTIRCTNSIYHGFCCWLGIHCRCTQTGQRFSFRRTSTKRCVNILSFLTWLDFHPNYNPREFTFVFFILLHHLCLFLICVFLLGNIDSADTGGGWKPPAGANEKRWLSCNSSLLFIKYKHDNPSSFV